MHACGQPGGHTVRCMHAAADNEAYNSQSVSACTNSQICPATARHVSQVGSVSDGSLGTNSFRTPKIYCFLQHLWHICFHRLCFKVSNPVIRNFLVNCTDTDPTDDSALRMYYIFMCCEETDFIYSVLSRS